MKGYWIGVIAFGISLFLSDLILGGDFFFEELNMANAFVTVFVGAFIIHAIKDNDNWNKTCLNNRFLRKLEDRPLNH